MNFLDAPATLIILVLTALVSLYALYGDTGLIDKLSFRPDRILKGKEYHRLISGGFVHASMGHLAFNLITLYFFGPYLEIVLGSARFLIVYLGSELAAHALTLYLKKDTPGYAAVGASGAISGVLFSFCLFRPFERIYIFFALPIVAWLFAILFVAISIYSMKGANRSGGIAHEAHLGGAIGGLLLTLIVEPRAISVFLGQLGF